ncbi:hypothetical protein [Sandaracinus amylolyticus]|uniref:hypothetical protein n=1 Tax=Sandaracinus amylolyticus TaxID=927083 RepID=UPI001F20F747|nr:hypothetical protein [Sandaracinus amylolyticus]UJR85076.1 Hypothetical protein I5071_71550 [Sandaracinus amylolyticus]
MRMLGSSSSLATFRYDLVFLHASLLADDRPAVNALAPRVAAKLAELRSERDAFELAEDAAVVLRARKARRDAVLDKQVIGFGGHVRAIDPTLYAVFFKSLSPSRVAKLGLDDEIEQVRRIVGELARLPADHPERAAYETSLRGALDALVTAKAASDEADTALALARSRVEQFKLELDRTRVELHGQLVTSPAARARRTTSSAPPRPRPRTTTTRAIPSRPLRADVVGLPAPAAPGPLDGFGDRRLAGSGAPEDPRRPLSRLENASRGSREAFSRLEKGDSGMARAVLSPGERLARISTAVLSPGARLARISTAVLSPGARLARISTAVLSPGERQGKPSRAVLSAGERSSTAAGKARRGSPPLRPDFATSPAHARSVLGIHRWWFVVALMASASVMSFVTMKTALVAIDGDWPGSLYAYGFPLPWHRWSMASSLEWCIEPFALTFDLVVHVLVALVVLVVLRRRLQRAPSRGVLVLATIAFTVTALPLAALAVASGRSCADFDKADFFRPAWRAVHVGLGFPYSPW